MFKIKLVPKIIDNFYLCFFFKLKVLYNLFLIFLKKFTLLLCLNLTKLRSFISFLDIILFGLIKGYSLYIELFGAGFKFRLITHNFFFGLIFRVGYSHLIYSCLACNLRFSLSNKLNLFFYSNNFWYLKNSMINYV